jgi:molybdate transport system substrate-binding protein
MRWLALLFFLLLPAAVAAQEITVFAAASLTDALQDVGRVWEASGHPKLRFSFAASSTLARQIDQGAPANLFASADEQWMNWAAQRHLIADDTRRTLLGNTLVLVMPKDRVHPVTIGPGCDLMALLGPDGRLATGDPTNVPAGIYAKQALTKLGLWTAVEPRLARTDDVRSALLLVERGEVPAGIVYSTDAAVAPGVAIAGAFPENTHDPIVYPFAVTRVGDTPAARAFLDYLAGPEAGAIFARRGFKTE